jgi:hypothetical protein
MFLIRVRPAGGLDIIARTRKFQVRNQASIRSEYV